MGTDQYLLPEECPWLVWFFSSFLLPVNLPVKEVEFPIRGFLSLHSSEPD